MSLFHNFRAVAVAVSIVLFSCLSLTTQTISAQSTSADTKAALQRGYRTGYSDGYMSGYRDSTENAARNFEKHREYAKADRAYTSAFGSLEDYRDGYQQGFESGYNTGFEKRSFDSALPSSIGKRGATAMPANVSSSSLPKKTTPTSPKLATKPPVPVASQASGEPIILIPSETELVIELVSEINTLTAKAGDKFQAKIVSPYEITGAIIDGHLVKVTQPGRLKRKAALQFSFDQIRLTETRWSNFNAMLTEVIAVKDNNVKEVDIEGTAQGKGTAKKDGITIGGAAGTGLIVGAVVGGPVGAAVGAGMGAAFGVGAVVIERGKQIKLAPGQQLRIKTGYEVQIR
jgi:hypothetical protein